MDPQYFIHKVGRGKDGAEALTFDEAYQAGRLLLSGGFSPRQEGAFLMAMRVKSEEPQEIAGLVRALRESGRKLQPSFTPLEIPSYAGKQDAVNILPAAALIARAAGVPILIHGRKENPDRLGSEEIFESLGIPTKLPLEKLGPLFERTRFGFVRVDEFHPALARFLSYKSEMGVRSTFFVISRLANPAGSRRVLVPITHKPYFEKYEGALKLVGVDRGIVFFSNEGEAELPYHGALTAVVVEGAASRALTVKPDERIRFDDAMKIRPGPEATLSILRGETSSAAALAIQTAGLYLFAHGLADDLAAGVKFAYDALPSALETLSSIQSA